MILSICRPYFAPYPGYFYRIYRSDRVVLLDDVQFPRGTTWITRNRFKNDQGVLWLTVPVRKKHRGLQQIKDVRINTDGRWPRKHPAALKTAYARAPYLKEHLSFIEAVFDGSYTRILDMDRAIIQYTLQALGITRDIVLQSELGIRGAGDRLLVEICRKTGATTYLAQSDVRKYIDADLFARANIRLEFCQPPPVVYPQLWGEFVSNLSTLDLILNCGPKALEILVGN